MARLSNGVPCLSTGVSDNNPRLKATQHWCCGKLNTVIEHTHTPTHTHTHTCINTHTLTHTCMHAHTHTHIHANTHTQRKRRVVFIKNNQSYINKKHNITNQINASISSKLYLPSQSFNPAHWVFQLHQQLVLKIFLIQWSGHQVAHQIFLQGKKAAGKCFQPSQLTCLPRKGDS